MKTRQTMWLLIAALTLAAFPASGQRNKVSQDAMDLIKNMVENRTFAVKINLVGDDMTPAGSEKYLVVADSVFRLIAPVLSRMEGRMENYEFKTNKKGVMTTSFAFNTLDRRFTYTIDVRPNGQSTVRVLSAYDASNRRVDVMYYGDVILPALGDEE